MYYLADIMSASLLADCTASWVLVRLLIMSNKHYKCSLRKCHLTLYSLTCQWLHGVYLPPTTHSSSSNNDRVRFVRSNDRSKPGETPHSSVLPCTETSHHLEGGWGVSFTCTPLNMWQCSSARPTSEPRSRGELGLNSWHRGCDHWIRLSYHLLCS